MDTDRERFRRAFERCTDNARGEGTFEARMLWVTIADSYQFLIDREDRLEREAREPSRGGLAP